MRRWHCYLLMLMHDASWLGWSLLAVILILVAGGFIISPWIGIAAIGFALFIAMMAMSFVIMAYGFNSFTGVNMMTHTLAVDGSNITIGFEEGDAIEIDCRSARPYHIFPGGVLLPVSGAREGWLWIPTKAFENDNDMKEFLKTVYLHAKCTP